MIRKSTIDDLAGIMDCYAFAREQMRRSGNPTQWGNHAPSDEKILADIASGNGYVIKKEGQLCGVFAFVIGEDPTYAEIRDGKWLNDEPYGTIHRLAANHGMHGLFDVCLEFCQGLISNIRIDTHRDNAAMLHLITSRGFTRCGIIRVDDGTERIAFQKKSS